MLRSLLPTLLAAAALTAGVATAAAAAEPERLSVPVKVGDLNTRQIAALDRAKTVAVLQGGMLEEHGPYLPAFTDGILSARLTEALTKGLATELPGWTVLVFPPISVGTSGSNEIGGRFSLDSSSATRAVSNAIVSACAKISASFPALSRESKSAGATIPTLIQRRRARASYP